MEQYKSATCAAEAFLPGESSQPRCYQGHTSQKEEKKKHGTGGISPPVPIFLPVFALVLLADRFDGVNELLIFISDIPGTRYLQKRITADHCGQPSFHFWAFLPPMESITLGLLADYDIFV